MDDKIIGILGSNGKIGSILVKILQEKGYVVKCGYNKNSNIKDERGYYFDVRDEEQIDVFCKGISLLVGTAGPSSELSELMYSAALKKNIYYIDPGGSKLLHFENNPDAKAIVNTGFMPGLLGVIFIDLLEKMNKMPNKVEIIHGGKYNFSKSSKNDFINACKENFDGHFMKSLIGGDLRYSEQLYPTFLPCELMQYKIFPYLINEVEYIGKKYKIDDIYSYTAIGNKIHKNPTFNEFEHYIDEELEKVLIYINCMLENYEKKILLSTSSPNYITAYIIYTVIEEIFSRNLQVVGINRYCDLFYDKGICNLLNKLPIILERLY